MVFATGFLVFQVFMAVRGIGERNYIQFAWRMFLPHEKASFEIEFRDGRRVEYEAYQRERKMRLARMVNSHVNYRQFLPRHLCKVLPEAVRIHVIDHLPPGNWTHPCR